MRWLRTFQVVIILLLAPVFSAMATDLHFSVGESQLLPMADVSRVAVGDPAVLDVAVLDSESILLHAKGVGSTSLIAWQGEAATSFRVIVTLNVALAEEAIWQALPDTKLQVLPVGNALMLQGTVVNEAQRALAITVASQFADQVIDNLQLETKSSTSASPSLLSITAKVVEVDRRRVKELGLEWPTTLATLSSTGGLFTIQWSLPQLSLAIESGAGQVLSAPHVQVKPGHEAHMLAGGEFPIPTGSEQIVWKEYGVELTVTPTINGDVIEADVEVEVSRLDWTNAVGSLHLPSLRVRRASAQVALAEGKPAILGGLIQREQATGSRGVPGLEMLPIFGHIFQYSEETEIETEVIIVIEGRQVSPDE